MTRPIAELPQRLLYETLAANHPGADDTYQSIDLPAEIDGHLMESAVEGCTVTLHIGERSLTGRLDLPDGPGEIAFVPDQAALQFFLLPDPDTYLQAEYSTRWGDVRFATRVRGRTETGRLRLDRPRRISHLNRRLVPRMEKHDQGSILFRACSHDLPTLNVEDLTEAGLALELPRGVQLEVGMEIEGTLALPGRETLPVTLQIRHLNERPGGCILAGACFSRIQARDQHRLSLLLEQPGFVAQVA